MSGFFGSNEANRLGGFLKQVMSDMETSIDTLLENNRTDNDKSNDVYMDPTTGMITAVPKSSSSKGSRSSTPTNVRNGDLSSRLAAAVSDKGGRNSPLQSKDLGLPDPTPASSSSHAPVEPESTSSTTKISDAGQKEKGTTEGDMSIHEEETTKEDDDNKSTTKDMADPATSTTETIIQEQPIDLPEEEADISDIKKENIVSIKEPNDDSISTVPSINDDIPSEKTASQDEPRTPEDLARVLDEREKQLLQIMEKNALLHDRIHELEEADKASAEKIKVLEQQQLTEIPTGSVPRNVKALQSTIETMKKQLATKDEQIQGLMQEGEKLSKVELRQSTMIKKLRSEKTDQEKATTDLQKKLEKAVRDLSIANTKIAKATENEKKLQETTQLLSEVTESQTKQISSLEASVTSLREQYTEAVTELSAATADIEEARSAVQAELEASHVVLLEKETKANEDLRKELDTLKEQSAKMEKSLKDQIHRLEQESLRIKKESAETEEQLREKILAIEEDLNQSNVNLEDLRSKANDATLPFLMQIEELQRQCREAKRDQEETRKELIRLEHDLTAAKQELSAAHASTSDFKQQLDTNHEAIAAAKREVEQSKIQLTEERQAKTDLESNMRLLKRQLAEQESREHRIMEDQESKYKTMLAEEKQRWEQHQDTKDGMARTTTRQKTPDESDRRASATSPILSIRSSTDSGSNEQSLASPTMSYRQLKNQLEFYQIQLETSTQTRDDLVREMEKMNLDMDNLRKKSEKLDELEASHLELNQRYQASLELLGERTEQVEELKNDVADVKEVYRMQIVELVQKIDHLSREKNAS